MHELLKKYPIITDQVDSDELEVIIEECERVMGTGVQGDVVEFGCYMGTTSLFLQRLLQGTGCQLHVYDSFAGLPPKAAADMSPAGEQFRPGELAASKAQFIKHFKQAGLKQPVIHKGWFADFTHDDLPSQVVFAFLDGDYYDSIWQSLRLVWPRLSDGATVIVDDYQSEALPGARKAVDDWLKSNPCKLRTQASLAIITR